jgi:DegV family protein with EDD domain
MAGQKIKIVTDSSANIPKDALVGLDVATIPLWLIWEGECLLDGIDIDPPTFYQRLRGAQTLPSSSQPTVEEFMDFYRSVGADCDAIVSVLVSAKISGTITNARAAIQNLPEMEIKLVDAYSSSMGLGLVVLAAARAAAAGKTVGEVVASAEAMRNRVNFLFVVDTLEYLHKGGRIGGAKRLLGTALSVKPLLEFRDGQIEAIEQVRTKRKAVARLFEIAEERLAGAPMGEATVVDVDCKMEADEIGRLVQERFHPQRLYRSEVSPVVGTHVGPGTIGLAFYAAEEGDL